MKKYIILLCLVGELLASSFGASSPVANIELSDSEKLIFKNQKDIKINKKELIKIRLKLNSIKESVDGLKSIIESTTDKISTSSMEKDSISSKELDKLKKRLDDLEKDNNKRFKKIEKSIDKILKLLSSQNVNKNDKKINPSSKKQKNTKKNVEKINPKEAFKKAETFFKRKRYKDALKYYLIASEKKYNLSNTYFKMAESFYYQKKYDDAIVYYKKSVNIKDDPKFLPKLLLHTGLSFKNIGDKNGAKKFLEAVKDGFPKSNEAKLATKFLKKL